MKIPFSAPVLAWALLLDVCSAQSPIDEYLRDLKSDHLAVRVRAAASLGRMGDKAAVPALVEALKDGEADVRREAAKALGLIKDARAAAPLVDALRDRDMNVRLYAAYALGEIRDPKAAKPLLQALRDAEWCVRNQAAWALREIHDPAIAEPLVAALKTEKPDEAHILWLLRHVGATDTTKHVAALLKNPAVVVRMRAVRALGELHDKEAVDPLIAALADSDADVRLHAIRALAKFGDDRAEQPMRELVAGEQNASVREAAEEALRKLLRHDELAAHWSFDDQNTEVAKDVTGLGNDGEIKGCTPVKGKIGHALAFSEGKFIELGRPAGLPIANQPLTFMAWVKSDAENGVIIARGGGFCGYSLYIKDGLPKFGIHRTREGPAHIAAGTEEVVGAWVHLAGVVKNDCVEVHVNGKLAGTTKTPGFIPGNCGQGMEIGFDVANSPAEICDNFEGIIDEVRIFNAALAEEDIAKQLNTEH